MGEDPQHVGELAHFGAAAAELARNARLDEARLAQEGVVLGNEAILFVCSGGALGQGFRAGAALWPPQLLPRGSSAGLT
jgi:hypothetical protein